MVKQFGNSNTLLSVWLVLIVFVSACSDNQVDPDADLATEGDSNLQNEALIAELESITNIEFDDYEDQYLSTLKWVSRDGIIKKGADFSVDYNQLPAFKAIKHIPDRKQAFFDYLRPAIEYQNQLIRERRQILKGIEIKLKHSEALNSAQSKYMEIMRERYRVAEESTTQEAVDVLLRRIDTLPVSMVLAQAAMESAWGTSRFAREANNLFGQWCFSEGCGLVPNRRLEGKRHEVQKFASIDKAIGAYFLNINSHPTYALTRDIRDKLRASGKPLTGYALVAGLENYSARGHEYIEELRNMIKSNNLDI